jgi:hypothetical protein
MSEPLKTPESSKVILSQKDLQSLTREAPRLPQIPTPTDLQSTIKAINQIKEILETREGNRGSQVDAAVTWRDLLSNGIAQAVVGGTAYSADPGSGNVTPIGDQYDVSIPPPPTGLSIMGAIANIILSWAKPTFHNFAYTEIWRSPVDDIGQAVLIAQTTAWVYADSIGAGKVFYYWIRHVATSGVVGPFNKDTGTRGETGYDASYLLDVLAANPPAGVNYNPLLYVQSDPTLVIDGQPIPVGVYMNSAYIRNASISNAMIQNLAVDNAKIANLDAVKITAGDIDAARMTANIVTAATGRFNTLSALSASLGTVQINNNGWLRTVGVTDYNNGKGLYMDASLFRIGDPAGDGLWWNGTNLYIKGNLDVSGDGSFHGRFYAGQFAGMNSATWGSAGGYIGTDGAVFGYTGGGVYPWVSQGNLLSIDNVNSLITLSSPTLSLQGRSWHINSDGTAQFVTGYVNGNLSVDSLTVRGGGSGSSNYSGIGARAFGGGQFTASQQFTVPAQSFVTLLLQFRTGSREIMSASVTNLPGGSATVTYMQIDNGTGGGAPPPAVMRLDPGTYYINTTASASGDMTVDGFVYWIPAT